MQDTFALRYRGPRPSKPPQWVREWNGYALPAGATFKRDQLIELAWANGFRLSPAILNKWRVWRFLPTGPVAGGATGKGRGKGETWRRPAALRVAWLSRWRADSLTYDVLRLALWPWTPAMEKERLTDVRQSLRAFVDQDRLYHFAVLGAEDPDKDGGASLEWLRDTTDDQPTKDYIDVVLLGHGGEMPSNQAKAFLSANGCTSLEAQDRQLELLEHLNVCDLASAVDQADDQELIAFIGDYRQGVVANPAPHFVLFHDSPLALARIIARELLRFRLERGWQPPPRE